MAGTKFEVKYFDSLNRFKKPLNQRKQKYFKKKW